MCDDTVHTDRPKQALKCSQVWAYSVMNYHLREAAPYAGLHDV